MLNDCGMMLVISAMVAASEREEPVPLTDVEGGGREDELVGRMVRVGVAFFLFPDVCGCSLWKIDGLLGGVLFANSPGDGS